MAAVTLVDAGSATSAPPPRPAQYCILSLPDPADDNAPTAMRDYMLVSSARRRLPSGANDASGRRQPCDIHEIQIVLPHGGKHASYFVGSRVVSDPALHVATRVDPLFFALAAFHRAAGGEAGGGASDRLGMWRPWDQALDEIPPAVLRALDLDPDLNVSGVDGVGQLGHLVEVSDMCGDDLILCRFSEERAVGWLKAKYERSVAALHRRLIEKKRMAAKRRVESSVGSGAFSSSFTVAEDGVGAAADDDGKREAGRDEPSVSDLSEEEKRSARIGALQLVCGYLPSEWRGRLGREVGVVEDDWMCKKKVAGPAASSGDGCSLASGGKRPRSSWEVCIGQDDVDALLQYTAGSGGGGRSGGVVTPGDKSDIRNAQSVGLKRLAKVNTKGMKSLTSFFGAGKKKKK